ncbi:MAG: VWA domain-containing protein [Oscillatoriales cyanobacterium C42_A2020_001]|nr:VWA domain-containing protein [Leptolyngbyaceae cyanobacterium C42_A2020_001]
MPLLDLFNRLREAGVPLGIADYQAVLRSLQGGFGVGDREALARLCKTVWVRSPDEQRLFDFYFDQLFGEPPQTLPDESSLPPAHSAPSPSNPKVRRLTQRLALAVISGFLWLGLSEAMLPPQSPYKLSTLLSRLFQPPPVPPSPSPSPTLSPSPFPSPFPSASPSPSPTPAPEISPPSEQYPWLRYVIVAIGVIPPIWVVILALQLNAALKQQRHERSHQPDRPPQAPPAPLTPQILADLQDEIQAAQAVRETISHDEEPVSSRFLLSSDYLPVTQRQMKQCWRHLRRMVRQGIPTELDVDATVYQIGRQGVLLSPVLLPRRVNRTELLLLIDQDGSMVPFHSLSVRLVETAIRGGRLGGAGVYYLHNAPSEHLYHDPLHQEAEAIQDVLGRLHPDRTVVLIFSDAGAARGSYSSERLELTNEFLERLRQSARRMVWLNPMPRSRWDNTTAAAIAQRIPMFEATREGLDNAIDTLRGRLSHPAMSGQASREQIRP